MSDPGGRLRAALSRERRPEPGPFFAARIAHRVLADDHRRRRGRRPASPLLSAAGFLLLCAGILYLTAGVHGPAGDLRVLALVPAGFGAWSFRREIGREIRAAVELILG